jgi:hypothetical protein
VGQFDGVLDGEVHALAARRRDQVSRVAGQEQQALLHRLDHPDPQVENSHLAQRRIQRPANPQAGRQLVADPLLRPVRGAVGAGDLQVVTRLSRPRRICPANPRGCAA